MKPPFDVIVDKYIKLVYFFVRRWIYDQSLISDIVQSVFLAAMKRYDQFSFSTENELKSWLLQITRNKVIDHIRSKKNIQIPLSEKVGSLPSEEDLLEFQIQQEHTQSVEKALETLDPQDKELVKLRIHTELSFKEIGYIFDISEASAKMRFYRIITKLKEVLL